MIELETLNKIGKVFIGDTHQIFPEKKGYQIVEFFNKQFGGNDTYGPGFPSKWAYTRSKLKELNENEEFEKFINIILDQRYIMKELGIGRIESLSIIEEMITIFNEWLYIDYYSIVKNDNRYVIINIDKDLEPIGSGGFAKVYKQNATGRALKQLNDESVLNEQIRSRFKREFEITRSIGDLDNVINVYEFDKNDYSYTMELADETLLEYIEKNELEENQKIDIIEIILKTMVDIHNRDIIHRDLSPKNILIIDGVLKISDFGLGKDLTQIHSHLTVYTNNYGQYDYCAPEQRDMLVEGDKRSDVFSLGKLINFIITGNPNGVNHFLRGITSKATINDPKHRYKSAQELYLEVRKLIDIHKKGIYKDKVYRKINLGVFDEEVNQYLYQIDPKELNESIKSKYNFIGCVYNFIESNEDNSIEIMNLIYNNYQDVCKDFSHYDNFAQLSDMVLRGNTQFEAKRIAAQILKFIASDVNRFRAQRLIESIIDDGIDPILEEIIEL